MNPVIEKTDTFAYDLKYKPRKRVQGEPSFRQSTVSEYLITV
jgi:hypothetical protein